VHVRVLVDKYKTKINKETQFFFINKGIRRKTATNLEFRMVPELATNVHITLLVKPYVLKFNTKCKQSPAGSRGRMTWRRYFG